MLRRSVPLALSLLVLSSAPMSGQELPENVKKIVFLGDSITFAGGYVAYFETELLLRLPGRKIEVLNVGLPSETVSGLSEEGHAGGKFPRPDVHERLARVLDKTRPDLVFACYGMNDGIYLPLAEDRLARYQDGLRRLRAAVEKAGAAVIHLTPPVFDPEPIRARLAPIGKIDYSHPYEKYDEVLDRYAAWLLEQRKGGWKVIDIHFPMKEALLAARRTTPKFTYAGDGVHPNLEGQVLLGRTLVASLRLPETPKDASLGDVKDSASKRGKLFKLVESRQRVLRDAWLSHTGHKRPLAAGLPLAEAQAKAADLDRQIRKLID